MYQTKYARGVIPIGDFIRYDKGAETFYESIGGSASKTMNFLQSHVSQFGCKTKMQKMLLIDEKALTVTPIIKITILQPAPPKQQGGVKKGSKRNW